jgi:hypothetical protein
MAAYVGSHRTERRVARGRFRANVTLIFAICVVLAPRATLSRRPG